MIPPSRRGLDMLARGPVPRAAAACRHLALRCPVLRRGGITTTLDEAALRVTIRRGPRALTLAATDAGWRAVPDVPWLRFALGDTSALARRAAALLDAGNVRTMRDADLDACAQHVAQAAEAAHAGKAARARALLGF